MNSSSSQDHQDFKIPSPPIEQGPIYHSRGNLLLDTTSARPEKFTWDFIGLFGITFAFITALSWFNLTDGSLVNGLVHLIRQWLGLGGLFVIGLIGFLGVCAILQSQNNQFRIPINRILVFEGFLFCLTAGLSALGGHSLTRAEDGLDGGIIGWGLSELLGIILPQPLVILLLFIFVVVFGIYSFGLNTYLQRVVDRWLQEAPEKRSAWIPLSQPVEETATEEILAVENVTRKNKPRTQSSGVKKTARESIQPRDESLPPVNLLIAEDQNKLDEQNIHETALLIERTLTEFGIPARVVGYRVGPTVTQFGVEPGYIERKKPDGTIIQQKVRVSQIAGLSKDLARALSAERLRIEAPVPGQSFIGIEAPNAASELVRLRPILESKQFQQSNSKLSIAIGRNVSGQPVVADLSRMPHLLIAGTTGSGKSICIQGITLCLAMNNSPEELRLVMLDPKMVELVRFNGLPHLLGNVETELDRMIGVLRWAISQMENRYKLLELAGVRDLESYNRRMKRKGEKILPRIVIMIDELADLIMSAPDQVEIDLARLAQKARATGIHLIIATQRPSTDVLTGVIKSNFPARIAFTVATSVDSRVILDVNGAESLLGKGDLLFLNPEVGVPIRAQGVFIQDQEIESVINYWKENSLVDTETTVNSPWEEFLVTEEEGEDNLVEKAIEIIRETGHANKSLLQRRLKIGFPRAARLMDELEEQGIVGPAQSGGRERDIYLSDDSDDLSGEDSEGEYNS